AYQFTVSIITEEWSTRVYSFSLHDALPICYRRSEGGCRRHEPDGPEAWYRQGYRCRCCRAEEPGQALRRFQVHRPGRYHLRQLRSEENTSEPQSRENLVCRLLHEKKNRMQA